MNTSLWTYSVFLPTAAGPLAEPQAVEAESVQVDGHGNLVFLVGNDPITAFNRDEWAFFVKLAVEVE